MIDSLKADLRRNTQLLGVLSDSTAASTRSEGNESDTASASLIPGVLDGDGLQSHRTAAKTA